MILLYKFLDALMNTCGFEFIAQKTKVGQADRWTLKANISPLSKVEKMLHVSACRWLLDKGARNLNPTGRSDKRCRHLGISDCKLGPT